MGLSRVVEDLVEGWLLGDKAFEGSNQVDHLGMVVLEEGVNCNAQA